MPLFTFIPRRFTRMNHYETLGVEKGATKAEIKKAYRKLAQKHHPDRGGNDEEFRRVQGAYDTLSDDDRRAHYDAGGDGKVRDDKPELLQRIAALANEVVDNADVKYMDLVEGMRERVNNAKRDAHAALARLESQIQRRRTALLRFIRKGEGENILASVMADHIQKGEEVKLKINVEIAKLDEMSRFLDDYSYNFDDWFNRSNGGTDASTYKALQLP